MNFRALVVLGVGVLALGCGEPEDVGSSVDDVTVTPTGTSALGSFTVDVPAILSTSSDPISIQLDPESAGTSTMNTAAELVAKPVRVAPGSYCVRVHSRHELSDLVTSECGITIVAGKTTTFALGTVTLTADAAAFMSSQSVMGHTNVFQVTGPNVFTSVISMSAHTFASTAATFRAELRSSGAQWPAVETVLPRGGAVELRVPREDKVVRIDVSLERKALPDAVEGGGLRWRWPSAPDQMQQFREWTTISAPTTFTFFATDTTVSFELGGVEQTVSLAQPRRVTQFARRLEVTDVTETDDAGKVTTIAGTVRLKHATQGSMTWRDAQNRTTSSFGTGRGVFVWNGSYEVEVYYSANGVVKRYTETIRVP